MEKRWTKPDKKLCPMDTLEEVVQSDDQVTTNNKLVVGDTNTIISNNMSVGVMIDSVLVTREEEETLGHLCSATTSFSNAEAKGKVNFV